MTTSPTPPTDDRIAVVVVHRGNPDYLATCLAQARRSHPGGRVVLLGDEGNADCGATEHRRLDDPALQRDLATLRRDYRHHSNCHSPAFERFCLERWFYLRNYLREQGLTRGLALDSDVLLFCDVAEEARRFAPAAMTFARWDRSRSLVHCNFVQDVAALEDFCQYVLDVYRDPAALERLKLANRKKFGRCWISDMSLFHDWAARRAGVWPVAYLEDAAVDGVGYDSCLDDVRHYAATRYLPGLLRAWKRIDFEDGVPHAMHRVVGERLPMKCLHYHGRFKLLMARHAAGRADDWTAAQDLLTWKLRNVPAKLTLFGNNYLRPLVGLPALPPAPVRQIGAA